jgi:hypothetical protein
MRRLLLPMAILWSCGSAAAAPADNMLTDAEKKQGWVLLFDGKTLNGWMTSGGTPSKRPVQDAALNPHGCGDYMLVYEKPLGDFILSLDFMLAKEQPQKTYNSGLFFRTYSLTALPGKDVGYNGIEMAIDFDPADPARAGYHDTAAIYDLVKPRKCAMKPPGEWNRLVLTCDKNMIAIELNGEKVTEMNLDEWTEKFKRPDGTPHKFDIAYRDHPRRGFIGLQDHGAEIRFKNIKARPISEADRKALGAGPRRP